MNECLYCHGKLEERDVTRMQEFEGRWYLIEHVPALVCEQCGEIYYTMDAHDLVLQLVSNPSNRVRVEEVDVLDAQRPIAVAA